MSANFYESELRMALRKEIESSHIKELGDSAPFFAKLAKIYPAIGSKIDWGQVPRSIERSEENEALQAEECADFFDEMVQKFHLSGDVIYVGDSATDIALAGSLGYVRAVLCNILTIPQHHYLIAQDYSWCMCFTMEGDMGFGFCPASANKH